VNLAISVTIVNTPDNIENGRQFLLEMSLSDNHKGPHPKSAFRSGLFFTPGASLSDPSWHLEGPFSIFLASTDL
jgi:hypothetical protein